MFKLIYVIPGIIILVLASADLAFGRGFGGFHGGGGFGGYRGGGFHAGEGGGFYGREGGAYKATGPRGTQVEGFHGSSYGGFQRQSAGGFRGEAGGAYHGYGAYHGQTGSFRDSGMGAYHEGGYYGGYHAGGVEGFHAGAIPTRGGVNQFLGLPTDAGFHAAGRGVWAGGGYVAGRGIAGGYGVHYVSPSVYRSQALAMRNNFYEHHLFTPGWYGDHPYVWTAAGLTASAWAPATWASLGGWCGVSTSPVYYDYGNTITYQDESVYTNGQPVATTSQYYDQASTLAGSASSVPPQETDSQWMPLGVFGLAQGDQTDSSTVIQLAVNKAGLIGGNYYNDISDTTLPIQGAVDKKNQRVAWTVGKNKNTVFDTGLYNLTKDEAPVLVHFGKDKTQQWLMVRMKQGTQPGNNTKMNP